MVCIATPYELVPTRTVEPETLPLTVDEVMRALKIDGDDEVEYVNFLIASATSHLDGPTGILGRCLVTQTWLISYPEFSDRIWLPVAPVSSITSITYRDSDNDSATVSGGDYALYNYSAGAAVETSDGASWPSTYTRPDAVTITFVAGYGAASAVPPAIKHAMLLLIGHHFENRQAVIEGTFKDLPMGVQTLLMPFWRPYV